MNKRRQMMNDIQELYSRGYSEALRALPEEGPYTENDLRNALRKAGFTDAQIDARDYR